MKALVTGAPGWLGDRLVEHLVSQKNKVVCYVLKGSDVSKLKKLGVEIVWGDVMTGENLDRAMKGVEVVFHCAGLIHAKKVKDLYRVNVTGTQNVVDAAIKARVKKFIHISSNSPMGTNKQRDRLMKEDDPYRPYKNYGKSKMLAEQIVNKAYKEGKLDTTIIRPCWFYGPGQPPRQTTFFKMIKKGNPLMFGDGKNLRSMSYVDNIVEAMLLAVKSKKSSGQTYWIADEKPYSTVEIYETIADLFDVKLKPRYLPNIVPELFEIADDVLQAMGMYIKEVHVAGEMNKDIACSVEKAKKELGYKPKVSLKEGMKRSIEWCRAQGMDV
jgi:nucleoside-diphosphate-sugar epimerase